MEYESNGGDHMAQGHDISRGDSDKHFDSHMNGGYGDQDYGHSDAHNMETDGYYHQDQHGGGGEVADDHAQMDVGDDVTTGYNNHDAFRSDVHSQTAGHEGGQDWDDGGHYDHAGHDGQAYDQGNYGGFEDGYQGPPSGDSFRGRGMARVNGYDQIST
ncbi:hypothetical protein Q1695_012620 [Nippostrongylus brasiliensis]|nr:hypothetical protein Q1695_012620 [Nippostrongylus brasiliensis]